MLRHGPRLAHRKERVRRHLRRRIVSATQVTSRDGRGVVAASCALVAEVKLPLGFAQCARSSRREVRSVVTSRVPRSPRADTRQGAARLRNARNRVSPTEHDGCFGFCRAPAPSRHGGVTQVSNRSLSPRGRRRGSLRRDRHRSRAGRLNQGLDELRRAPTLRARAPPRRRDRRRYNRGARVLRRERLAVRVARASLEAAPAAVAREAPGIAAARDAGLGGAPARRDARRRAPSVSNDPSSFLARRFRRGRGNRLRRLVRPSADAAAGASDRRADGDAAAAPTSAGSRPAATNAADGDCLATGRARLAFRLGLDRVDDRRHAANGSIVRGRGPADALTLGPTTAARRARLDIEDAGRPCATSSTG